MNELDDFLLHAGVKGMKWGVVRWRKKAGKKITSALRKNKVTSGILDNKLSRKIGERTTKHEARYLAKGFSPRDAKNMAKRRRNAELTLAAVGAVVITVGAVTATKVIGREFVDKHVKTSLQNLSDVKDRDFSKPFYAAFNNADKRKYQGLMSGHLMKDRPDVEVFKHVIEQSKGLKIASHNNARKALAQAVEGNSQFKALVKEVTGSSVVDRSTYGKFNQAIANIHANDFARGTDLITPYYDKLKSMGYNGLLDLNDQKFSGFKAKNPAIVFDAGKNFVQSVSKIPASAANAMYNKEVVKLSAQSIIEGLAPSVVVSAGAMSVLKVVTIETEEVIKKGA